MCCCPVTPRLKLIGCRYVQDMKPMDVYGIIRSSRTFRSYSRRIGFLPGSRKASRQSAAAEKAPRRRLDVKVSDLQSIAHDEIAARLNNIAHQRGEHLPCLLDVPYAYLQQCACGGIESGVPKLLIIHLAKAFEAIDGQAATTLRKDAVHHCCGAKKFDLVLIKAQDGGAVEVAGNLLAVCCKPPCFSRAQCGRVKAIDFTYTANRTGKLQTCVRNGNFPSTFIFS